MKNCAFFFIERELSGVHLGRELRQEQSEQSVSQDAGMSRLANLYYELFSRSLGSKQLYKAIDQLAVPDHLEVHYVQTWSADICLEHSLRHHSQDSIHRQI